MTFAPQISTHTDDPSRGFIAVARSLADAAGPQGLTVGEIVDRLDERAAALLILILTLPCLVPGLPGAQILAVGLFLLAGQILIGRAEPWLPGWFKRVRIKAEWLKAIAGFAEKRLGWTQHLSRPRWTLLASGAGERLAALAMVLASIAVMLPITNTVPSIGLLFLSVGILQRDGVFVAIGAAIAFAWVLLLATLLTAFFMGAGFAMELVQRLAPWLAPGGA